jgi:putative SOS response-associated peptidase YedK
MCGRFRLSRVSKLAERFGIEPEDDWVSRYNIAPTQNIPVIRQHPEEPKRFGSRMGGG